MTHTAAEILPYHTVPGTAPDPDRRLLVVSYHFPPSPAVGGLRWQQLSWLAAERGWGVDVLARDPDGYRVRDESRLQHLPAGLRAFAVRTPQLPLDTFERLVADTLRGLSRRHGRETAGSSGQADTPARGRNRVPRTVPRSEVTWKASPESLVNAWHVWRAAQAERAWARAAVTAGTLVARPGVHRAIVACGPPHGVYTAGRWLAERLRLPLVLDFRDPWSLQQRLGRSMASPLWYRLAERDEAAAVARAALVVSNTEAAAAAMRGRYPHARVISVMNGMDEGDLPPSRAQDRFVIGYAGAIYLDRDPRPLLRAAARVARSLGLTPDRFGIELLGEVSRYDGQSLEDMTREEGVEGFVRVSPRRPYPEAMAFLASCAMLVSLPQDSTLAIPSKVFEYLRFPAWLLALADPDSATAHVLDGTGADVVAPDDVEGIAAAIRRRYEQFSSGVRPQPLGTDPRLTRRYQGSLLLDALEDITQARDSRPSAHTSRGAAQHSLRG